MYRITLLLVINIIVIGFFALSRAQGPYSSFEQELVYRYGSLAFFVAGVVIPCICLVLFQVFVRQHITVASVWLVATLFAFIIYGAATSGGV